MPIALVQSAIDDANAVNNTTRAFSSNLTAGNLAGASIVTFYGVAGTTITTPTDTLAHTYLPVSSAQNNNANTINLRSWYVSNCSAGADTVTADISGTGNGEIAVVVYELSGVVTSSPLSGAPQVLGHTATSTPATPAMTPADNGCILIGVLTAGGAPITITPAAGWTTMQEYEGGNNTVTLSVIYKIQTTATPEAASWTLSGSTVCLAHVFALRPSVAVPPSTERFSTLTLLGHGR